VRQFENIRIPHTLAAKSANKVRIMAALSQVRQPRTKQTAEKDSRQIKGMACAERII
jgi:hypothetical protein